ncbi:hypothetical protein [Limimaricola pyoseonensis]|uniref:Uncharacterized protein n=1 Tax=Limimaricola pyoseonensis TaxID=521013 RepID=A0A1G6ZLM0_9RHOB|nr:hypothetical protein [Limimaricola pyoseonensis]SDE03400.1 hypothetical protein SAMN04488567_0586 [Limimaricola pyoseonensis]
MDIVRSSRLPIGSALPVDPRLRPEPESAAAPRPDLPPVSRGTATDAAAPRPPDLRDLGRIRAGLLLQDIPPVERPQQALKPWGVAILPDAQKAQERREQAEALQHEADAKQQEADRAADAAETAEAPPTVVAEDPRAVPQDPFATANPQAPDAPPPAQPPAPRPD